MKRRLLVVCAATAALISLALGVATVVRADSHVLTASFTYNPSSPLTDEQVTFTSTSTAGDLGIPIVSYSWDLDGDGSFGDVSGDQAQRSFSESGAHLVGLRVTNLLGESAETSRTVAVENRAPTASFDFSPSSPLSGETVQFDASGASDPDGSVDSYEWDLDDDGSYDDATGQTTSDTFDDPGTYTVGLRVTDDEGATGETTRDVTVDNRDPSAAFTFSPSSPQTGESVSFTSTSTDPDGSITSYGWDLDDDGQFDDAVGSTAQRAFDAPGTYTVGLRVTDGDGGSDETTRQVTIGNRGPTAAFDFSPSSPITNQTVTFSSTSSDPDGSIATHAWDLDNDGDFDDGNGSTAQRSFSASGTYTVGLRVTDGDGGSDEASREVTIDNQGPTASFTVSPSSPLSGEEVDFGASGSSDPDGSIDSYEWDLDNDGSYDDATGETASRSFSDAGTYTVGLRVTDDGGATDTTSRQVTVGNRGPTASFNFSPSSPETGQSVGFTSTSTDADGSIDSYAWDLDDDGDFDDGTGATASRSFSDPGSHTVSLRVTDDGGASSTVSRTVTVSNRGPTASFDFSPSSPLTNQTVTFTSTSSDPDGSIATHVWDLDNDGDFDDGNGSTAQRSFSAATTYTVRLRVTDDEGSAHTASRSFSVGNRPPTASFDQTPAAPLTHENVTFTSTSSDPDGSFSSQVWDIDNDGSFDDGNTASVSHSFDRPGTYTVRLRVTDNNGAPAETSKQVTIGNRAPAASFTYSPLTPVTNQQVTFTSTSIDSDGSISGYAWDLDNDGNFDDGGQATAKRIFTTPGQHTVKLRVTDNSGTTAVASTTIVMGDRPPSASFVFSPSSPLTNETVNFVSTSTDPDDAIVGQMWDLDNDGLFDDGTAVSASRSFPAGGTYTVSLMVVDEHGASAIASKTVVVANRPPVASFSFSPSVPMATQAVTFTSTASDSDGTIAGQSWDVDNDGQFDDGNGATVSRQFPRSGSNTVRLRVVDNLGAVTIGSQTVVVGNSPPIASFSVSPFAPKALDVVTFTSTSGDPDGSIASHAWDLDNDGQFDDGTTPTVTKTFKTSHNYTIRLRVRDNMGLESITSQVVPVANRLPVAAFTQLPADPTANEPITFTSTSDDADGAIASQSWDLDEGTAFDDGTGETASKSLPLGRHAIRLQVVDNEGGITVREQIVEVKKQRPTAAFRFSPETPQALETVTFQSTSTDDKAITSYAWDLDNDGDFDDGSGSTATRSFKTTGRYTVRLRVVDGDGLDAITAQTVAIGNVAPTASFRYAPGSPRVGQAISFFSTASDPDGPIAEHRWDLDNDGSYDDATGATATRSFGAPGTFTVRLRVVDGDGASAVAFGDVTVSPPPPPAPPAAPAEPTRASGPRLLNPFPVVRIAGTITRRGAKLRRLQVDGPAGVAVTIRCRGRRCPTRKVSRAISAAARSGKPLAQASKVVRFKRFEGRLLRVGIRLEVFVTMRDMIGKYTRFKIRRGRPPARIDRCLMPGETKPVSCPS